MTMSFDKVLTVLMIIPFVFLFFFALRLIWTRKRRPITKKYHELQDLHDKVQRIKKIGIMSSGMAYSVSNVLEQIVTLTMSVLRELAKNHPARPKLDQVVRISKQETWLVQNVLHQVTSQINTVVGLPIGGNETILLVEDDEAERISVQTILKQAGYRVLMAKNSTEAVASFQDRADKIDLVIGDIAMPKMEGYEVTRQLLSRRPDIKLLSFTSIQKPFNPRILLMIVRDLLDRPATDEFTHTQYTHSS